MTLTEEEKQRIKEGEEYRQSVQKKKSSRAVKLLLIFFGLLIIMAIALSTSSPKNTTSSQTNTYIPPQNSGINVSRETIIKALSDYVTFKKEVNLEGQENYVANNQAAEVQLLGPKDNLKSASFTAKLFQSANGSTDESVLAQTNIIVFASSVDKSCAQWFGDIYTNQVNPNKMSPFNKTEVACDRRLTLIYIPGDSITLGISPN